MSRARFGKSTSPASFVLLLLLALSTAVQAQFDYQIIDGGVTITRGCQAGSVTIPSTINGLPVTTIGAQAFNGCSGLTSVTIPNSVTTIGRSAFSECSSLTNITIPNSVTTIEGGAFSGCSSLTGIHVHVGNASFGSVEGVLFNQSRTTLIQYPEGKAGSYTIPNNVITIEGWAFSGCTSLTSVTIPNSVTSIRGFAFIRCTSLTSVTIPNSVTTIGSAAFARCTGLMSVTIPDSVTTIGELVFFGCSSLTSVTIPGSVTTIGQSTFGDCTSLTSVMIPNGVTSIGWGAFSGCTSLTGIHVDAGNASFSSAEGVLFDQSRTTLIQYPEGKAGSYTIPNSVTNIGWSAFSGCSSLTSVTIPNSVTTIGGSAFSGCTSLTSIMIPNGVTSIGDWAFSGCTSLTSVTIPNSVTGIGMGSFRDCISLTSVTIPNSVTAIWGGAFRDCTSLINVTIPNSVTTIGSWAFPGCTSLTGVYFEGDAPSIWEETFEDCPVAILFYRAGTTGWADVYQRPTALWVAPPAYADWLPLSALPARYPQATAETDDPDADGMTNRAEMLAGTDPTDSFSTLGFESVPRPGDSTDADRTPLGATQHAVYVRTVPGKTYGVQWADALDGSWRLDAVVTATTTQTRFVFGKPEGNRLYRVILAQ